MTTYRLNLKKAKKQRPLKDLSEVEKKGILDYLKENQEDKDAFEHVMKRYRVNLVTVIALITKEELGESALKGVGIVCK